MDEIGNMAMFEMGVVPVVPGEISPVERLLNEFEAHEANEEKSIEQYRKLLADLP